MTSKVPINFDNKNSAHDFNSDYTTPGIYYHYKDIGRNKTLFLY